MAVEEQYQDFLAWQAEFGQRRPASSASLTALRRSQSRTKGMSRLSTAGSVRSSSQLAQYAQYSKPPKTPAESKGVSFAEH